MNTTPQAALLIEPPNIDNLKTIASSNSSVAIRNALLAAIKWIQCLERQLAVEKTASFRDQVERLQDELAKLQATQADHIPDAGEMVTQEPVQAGSASLLDGCKSFPDSAACTMNRNSPMFAPFFAALLLEKAAQVCEGMHEEDRPGDYADAVRSMAAGMGE